MVFDYGKVSKIRYRADGENIMIYKKEGRGRESIYAKKRIEELYKIARKKINIFCRKKNGSLVDNN